MNDSYGRSPQFAFSNCKLSPLFLSNYSPRNDHKIYFADYIDTQFIHSGRMLNKIARIENCPIDLNYPKLGDINTSQNKVINDSNFILKNEYHKQEGIRDNQVYLSNFNTNFTKEDQIANPKIFAGASFLENNMITKDDTDKVTDQTRAVQENQKLNYNNINPSRNYSQFNRPIINSSIMRKSQSAFTENPIDVTTPKMNVTIINNKHYTINNFATQDQSLSKKRKRNAYIDCYNTSTSNVKSNFNNYVEETNISSLQFNNKNKTNESSIEDEDSNDISYDDNALGVNKITKRMIEENIHMPAGQLPRIEKLKKSKKNKNIKLKLEESYNNNISIHYQYLLEKFSDKPDEYCNFDNEMLKNRYLQYFTYGRSNELKLTFGDNPLNIFQDYHSWYFQELKKENSTKTNKNLSQTIWNKMQEISTAMSQLPILLGPQISKDIKMPIIIKKKPKSRLDPMKKNFQCTLCEESFNTGQGLGGHMSRKHQNKSEKFQKKKEVRKNREPMRLLLMEAKKKLCDKYSIDYEEQIKSKAGKMLIKKLINDHKDEFKEFRLEAKKKQFGIFRDERKKI